MSERTIEKNRSAARRGKIRTAVLISGSGSNMAALIESTQNEEHDAQIDLVISNRPDAYGLIRAQNLGVSAVAIDHKAFETRREFERAIDAALKAADIELICCAGFMRILTPHFVAQWSGRILNIHPSLLPKYKGLNTHSRALQAGDQEHGCSVHYVSAELDGGEIIAQARVPVLQDDTEQTLAGRVLQQEHPLYVRALKQVAQTMRTS